MTTASAGGSIRLSPHFTLAEMTATSHKLPNVPNPDEVKALTALCLNVLEPVRAHFGKAVRVNSGFRSQQVNAAVGSKPSSQHRKGQAADIEIEGVSNADLAKWIRDTLPFDQVILENYRKGVAGSGWVHVSWSGTAKRGGSKGVNSVLTMTLGTHGATYTSGINA